MGGVNRGGGVVVTILVDPSMFPFLSQKIAFPELEQF